MAQTQSLAALGLSVIGFAVATIGSTQENSVLGSVLPVAYEAVPAPKGDLGEQRPPEAVEVASRQTLPSILPSSRAQVRPVSRPLMAPGRPQPRDFLAAGPLVGRVMDPTFGPRLRPADLLVPDPPARLEGASDLLCIAVAIYHEARDQALDGQLAVASVILNRTKEPDRWGATPCAVVVPVQFSFLREDGTYPSIPKDEPWAIAVEMAREAIERGPSALVGQADHYHTPAVDPVWNKDMDRVVRIEDHIFFVDVDVQG